ncbi:MAG TPA: MFS transporter [Solirubrobacteraceae bacterium]|nr:MFS transporter [Solirubrobacteraceae bacterium]
MRPQSRRALWGTPAYLRLWSAVAISETGDWLLFIALPLYALGVSGSALSMSLVFLAELVPAVVVGTACGPLIDRRGPGRLLAALTAAQAVVLMPLLALGPGRLWILFAVAATQAGLTSITTPAQQALVPSLVSPRDLPSANALVDMAGNVARLAGSPLGGVLLPLVGLRALVLGDAVSFLLSALLLVGCGPSARRLGGMAAATAGGWLSAQREAWHCIRHDRGLLSLLAISLLASVAQGLFLVLFVLFVLRSLHAGDGVVGLLRGVQAVGGVLGGVVVGAVARRVDPRALTAGGLAAFGLVSLLTWNSPALTTATWWYVALFVTVGIPSTALVTGLITDVQQSVPAGRLGRVLSLMQVAQALGQGAGIVVAGLLGGQVSLSALLDVQAGCYLACAAIAAVHLVASRARGAAHAEADPARG